MPPNQGTIGFAGQFTLDTATIITADKQIVDVTAEVSEISIYEDTLNPVLSGTLVFSDNFNIQNMMPLIGQELLKLKIKTPSLEDPDDVMDFTEQVFFIHNIEAQFQTSATNQTLVLNFISMEAVIKQRKKKSTIQKRKGAVYTLITKLIKSRSKTINFFFSQL